MEVSDDDLKDISSTKVDDENTDIKLVFLGTFVHDNSTGISVDLVQFPKPILVSEIRVIPLGHQIDLSNGSFQLGATNPSEIELEFFYDDLQNPSKTVFERFGIEEKFVYNEKTCIQLITLEDRKAITNGVLVKGKYSTITLAVYGYAVTNVPIHEEIKITTKVETDKDQELSFERDSKRSSLDDDVGLEPKEKRLKIERAEESVSKSPFDISSENEADPKSFNNSINNNNNKKSDTEIVQSSKSLTTKMDEERIIESPLSQTSNFEIDEITNTSRSEIEDSKNNLDLTEQGVELSDISDGEISLADDDDDDIDDRLDTSNNTINLALNEPGQLSPAGSISKISVSTPRSLIDESDKQSQSQKSKQFDRELQEQDDDSIFEESQNFEEIISDEDLPEYQDYDIEEMEEYLNSKLSKQLFDPFSEDWSIRPLKNFDLEVESSLKVMMDPSIIARKFADACAKFSKDNFTNDILEDWVESVESLLPILPKFVKNLPEDKLSDLFDNHLSFWIEKGVNIEVASGHKSPPFIIRHLKLGIRLVQSCSLLGGLIGSKLVQKKFFTSICAAAKNSISIQHILFNLYKEKNMNISMQLLILKALDATISYLAGFNEFKSSKNSEGLTCFQCLINYSINNSRHVRLSFAIRSILKKIQFWTLLLKFEQIVTTTTNTDQKTPQNDKSSMINGDLNLDENDNERILECSDILEQLSILVENVSQQMSHPLRIFPTKCILELPQLQSSNYDSRKILINILKEMHFIQLCSQLLQVKNNIYMRKCILSPICSILQCLIKWDFGLLYLCSEAGGAEKLLRTLVQYEDNDNCDEEIYSFKSFGLYLVYSCEIVRCLDKIMVINTLKNHRDQEIIDENENENEDLKAIQILYSFLQDPLGRQALVDTLTCGSFISSLLTYNKFDNRNRDEMKSVWVIFLNEILSLVVGQCDRIEFLEKFGTKIHSLIASGAPCDRMSSILKYLGPTLNPGHFTIDEIDSLVKIIQGQMDHFLSPSSRCFSNNFGFPQEMITSLRILQSLCVRPNDVDFSKKLKLTYSTSSEDSIKELKYDIALCKMHAEDCLALFVNILNKICEEFIQPAVQSYLLIGFKGNNLTNLLLPLVRILRVVLAKVIKVRGGGYRDVTLIPVLLKIYGLMESIPGHSVSSTRAMEINQNIIAILLAFAIPAMSQMNESEELVKKSIWVILIKEVLKYTTSTPNAFQSGLNILSEILPLPLSKSISNGQSNSSEQKPTETEIMEFEECVENSQFRKLWSISLHNVSQQFQMVMSSLSSTANPELLNTLKTITNQLSDLSSSTTCLDLAEVTLQLEKKNVDPLLIPVDLFELCKKYLNDLDLSKEVETLCKSSDLQIIEENKLNSEKSSKMINLRSGGKPDDKFPFRNSIGLLGVGPKKMYLNHQRMMGGFGRGGIGMMQGGRAVFDPFRSRPPNTSRPPSLHVDDFVAMESSGGGSVGGGGIGGRQGQGMRNSDFQSRSSRPPNISPLSIGGNNSRSSPYNQQQQMQGDLNRNRRMLPDGGGYPQQHNYQMAQQQQIMTSNRHHDGNFNNQQMNRGGGRNFDRWPSGQQSSGGGGGGRGHAFDRYGNSIQSSGGNRASTSSMPSRSAPNRSAPPGGGPSQGGQRWRDKQQQRNSFNR